MTIEELISEGETLVRPSFLLNAQETDSGKVGYWGGERADMPDELPPQVTAFSGRRHIFSVSEALVSKLGINQGPFSLNEWENKNGDLSHRVKADSHTHFKDLNFSGEPLYAKLTDSFPPFPAVCLYGSDRVAAWLRELGLARHDYWRVPGELPAQYESAWQKRSPFFQQSADIVVGGWHFLWPDDDFFIPAELRLAALTLRDAEPWLEVWHSACSQGWRVKERIT